jgi:signal transduction histidine kinase
VVKQRVHNLFYFILTAFFCCGISSYSQSTSNKDIYIQNKFQKIDSLIELKQYDKALILIKNAKNTFNFKSNDVENLEFDFRYARILYENNDEEKALEVFLKGFDKLSPNDNSSLYVKYTNFLTKIFANSQNFDKAIQYNNLALKNALTYKDTTNILKGYVRNGSFYFAKDDLDSAKYFFRRVQYFKVTSETEDRISNAYNNLGVIASYENNFDLAKHYAKEALKIKERIQDTINIARLNVNLGNLHHYQSNYNAAIQNYMDAMNFIEKDSSIAALTIKNAIYDNLSVSYDSLKDYPNAYHNLVKSSRIIKKLNKENLAQSIAEVDAKYNLAREEQKTEEEKSKTFRAQVLFYGLAFFTITFLIIAFIFYKNYKLKQQNRLEQVANDTQTRIINATIDAKEKERKNIAEILHDSVSALLSSANLHLQASKSQLNGTAPPEIGKAQEIVNEASVKIRDLSHTLISSVLMKFGLAFAVHDLCEKYSNSELSLMSDDNGIKRYNQRFEIKIYHIIEELINNIIKHSKAKNASIILAERNGDKLVIQIIDDGDGFDIKKGRNKKGLGLSHIDARVKVMKGVFNINSKQGEGTSIFISVPIYQSKILEKV